MRGINITTGTQVKAIMRLLSGINPDTKIIANDAISMTVRETEGDPVVTIADGQIIGMKTQDEPLGIPFIEGENEAPFLKGTLLHINDDSDGLAVIPDVIQADETYLKDGQAFVITAVQLQDRGTDFFTDVAFLLFIEDADHNRSLVGYVVDSDDAEDTFIKDAEEWGPTCFGVVNSAMGELIHPDGVAFDIFKSRSAVEMAISMAIYAAVMDDNAHIYVNAANIQEATGFTCMMETVDIGAGDTGAYADIGIVMDSNNIVRLVYIDNAGDTMDRAIMKSNVIAMTANRTYAAKADWSSSSNVGFYPSDACCLKSEYDTSTFYGAAMAVIAMVDSWVPDEEDEGDGCIAPGNSCGNCEYLGTCPASAPDPDDEDD